MNARKARRQKLIADKIEIGTKSFGLIGLSTSNCFLLSFKHFPVKDLAKYSINSFNSFTSYFLLLNGI